MMFSDEPYLSLNINICLLYLSFHSISPNSRGWERTCSTCTCRTCTLTVRSHYSYHNTTLLAGFSAEVNTDTNTMNQTPHIITFATHSLTLLISHTTTTTNSPSSSPPPSSFSLSLS